MGLSKKQSLIYGCLIVLMLIFTGSSLILAQFRDINKLKKGLAKKIEELTKFHVTILGAELAIHHGLSVKLNGVSLRRNETGPADLTAEEIWVELGLLPLLAQELVIEKLLMRGSSINVLRKPDGQFDFVGLNSVFDRRTLLEESFFKIVKMGSVPQLVVQNGGIRFFDYFKNSNPVPIQLENINISIKKGFDTPSFSFLFRGNLVGSNKPAPFSISGKLRNPLGVFEVNQLSVEGHIEVGDLEILQLLPYIKQIEALNTEHLLISTDSDFSWSLDGRLILSGNLKYQHNPEHTGLSFDVPAAARQVALDYKVQWIEGTLEVKEAAFKFKDFQLSGNGKVEEMSSQNPKITFAVQSNALTVESMHTYPPFSAFPKPVHLVQETLQQGRLEIRSLEFDGTLDQLNHLDRPSNLAHLSGEVGLRKVNWNLPFVKLQKIGGVFLLAAGDGTIQIKKAWCRSAPNVTLEGSIKNVIYNPSGDLKVIGKLKLTELRKLLIRDVVNPELHGILDRFENVSGSGKIRLHFLGSLSDIDQLAIDGKYSFQKAGLRYLGFPHKFKNIEGKIGITHQPLEPGIGKKKGKPPLWSIQFANFKGDFDQNDFSGLGGEIRIGLGKPYIRSSGQIKIHAPEISQWLNRLENKQHEFNVLKEIEFMDGTLWVQIKGQGRSFDPHSLLTSYQIRAAGVSLKHAKLPQPILDLQGNLKFTPKGIEVQHLEGRYGNSTINIQGHWEDVLNLKVASANFSLDDVPEASWIHRLNMVGPLVFESQWTGIPNHWQFKGAFDLTKTAYRYDDQFEKGAESPNHLQIEGEWIPKQNLTIKTLTYELGPNLFHGTGKIRLSQKPKFSLRILADDLKPFSLGSHISLLRASRGGTLRLNVSAEGHLNDLERTMFKGTIETNDLDFQWDGFPHPVYVNAKVDFFEDGLNISSATLASSDSKIRVKGKSAWGENPSIELAVFGKKLDLNDVWPAPTIPFEGLRDYLKKSRIFSQGSARLNLNLNQYKFLLINFKNLLAEISLKDRAFLIHKMDIVSPNNNRIKNRGMIRLTDAGKFHIKSILQANNIEVDDFLDQLGNTFQNGLTGKAKIIQANLESEGTELSEFTQTLNGRVSVDLASGNLDKSKLMRGFWILFGDPDKSSFSEGEKLTENNLSLAYERIAGDFLIKNGVAETENYRFETAERKMSLVGTFDLHQRKMDTVVGVAPLVALDKIFTKIPILGKIITAGDEESLVKNYYEVKGPFNDPKIGSIPWTSLEKRVLGIFQGIFAMPRDLVKAPLLGPKDN